MTPSDVKFHKAVVELSIRSRDEEIAETSLWNFFNNQVLKHTKLLEEANVKGYLGSSQQVKNSKVKKNLAKRPNRSSKKIRSSNR